MLLGKTEEGKSTLADRLIEHARVKWPDQDVILYDTKPSWRATHELSGLPTTLRYRRWDTNKGVIIPHSVVIAPPADAGAQVRWAQQQGYHVIVAQIEKHEDIPWLAGVMRYAYEHKRKNHKQLHVVDETNHWFRNQKRWGAIITEILTSGRENNVGMLLGGQRPRNISVEAMESCTNLYWFYCPVTDDVKRLGSMGVPSDARPGASQSHEFYFFSHKRPHRGLTKLPPPKPGERRGG